MPCITQKWLFCSKLSLSSNPLTEWWYIDIYHSLSLPTGWLARLTMDRPCLVPRPVFPPHPAKLCLRDVCNLSELPSNRTSGQVSLYLVYEEKVCVRMYTCLTVIGFIQELWFGGWGYHWKIFQSKNLLIDSVMGYQLFGTNLSCLMHSAIEGPYFESE